MIIPMKTATKRLDVTSASADLENKTLAQFSRAIDRLIYLASTRDYNTGLYYHDGLASRYSADAASEALALCHQEVFQQLLDCRLSDLVDQMEGYISTAHTSPKEFITVWRGIEPYRITVPVNTDPVARELFASNIKIALAILEARLKRRPEEGSASSRPQ